MKIMTCFIDASAWVALVDPSDPNHSEAREYFEYLLERDAKLVTNNSVIDQVLDVLKKRLGMEVTNKFMKIIEESILTINLRMDWISRRVRRAAIANFLRSGNEDLKLYHFYLKETLKRKKVDIIFSYDQNVADFGVPVMPQVK